MLVEINEAFQVASITLLGLVCLFFAINYKRGLHTWTGIGFTLTIICYLIAKPDYVKTLSVFHVVILTGAMIVPLFFWLLSNAIFNDHFKSTSIIFVLLLLQTLPHYLNIYLFNNSIQLFDHAFLAFHILSQIISIGLLLAGLYVAVKTKQDDLIDSRLRFRNIFISITAALIGITLIAEVAMFGQESPVVLQTLQRGSILVLTAYFLISNFDIRSGFFFRGYSKPKTVVQEDPILEEKLQLLLKNEKIYRKEGLTIRELASLMNDQEYRLRRLINAKLGFKNFNDFLNQYRILEASEILTDSAQNRKTILEIAYELGYQSIGPFNKAFKEQKGVTPTVFRKTSQNN